jgi:HPt (histidine-containing phosphotransfer) domain-containing protein
MLDVRVSASGSVESPGADTQRPIDLVHLARMTLGDRSLEREVLQLFVRQASVLLGRMDQAEPDAIAALAHTLKGSARGLGAWRVAAAAEAVELAPDMAADALVAALSALRATVEEAETVITDLLRTN